MYREHSNSYQNYLNDKLWPSAKEYAEARKGWLAHENKLERLAVILKCKPKEVHQRLEKMVKTISEVQAILDEKE
jgi:hypothetical protein